MVKIDLENMTDICGGPMTLKQLSREIKHYMDTKTPDTMVITIEKGKKFRTYENENTHQKHYSVIYIPNKDFEKPYQKV